MFGNTSLFVSPDSQFKYIKAGRRGSNELLLDLADRFVHKGDVISDLVINVVGFAFSAVGKDGRVQ